MAGYATMTRVRGGRVRALAWDAGSPVAARRADRAAQPTTPTAAVEAGPRPTIGERWASFREELGMATFFLFDPESWR